jgi:hypothetical protein
VALLGEAFVRVRPDTDGFEQEASSKIGGGLRKVAGAVTAAFGAIKVGGFLKDAIGEASSYNETVSKAANIFGAQIAPEIQRFAKSAPAAFGISETAALGAAAQFGNMFRQLGFTSQAAAGASTNLIKTAADLGSFNNVDPSDVLERIGAALRGEFDSLQQLIPNINAARVEQEALAATGKKVASELTAQEKATATLAIIQKDGALAANDFAETSGGLANQQRILAATVDGLQQRLGQALLPAMTAVVSYLAANAEPAFNAAAQAVGVLTAAFNGQSEIGEYEGALRLANDAGIKARDVFDAVKEAVGQLGDRIASGDYSSVGTDLSSAADSASRLAPVVQDLAASVPSLSDALSVASTVLATAADHTDLLATLVPILAAGFVAFKVAQLASNVAAVASIPLRVAEIAAQRALTQSIAAQTAALAVNTAANGAAKAAVAGTTAATVAETAATNTSALARARATLATAAGTVVAGAATVATGALAAAQTVLNAVLAANPIGLVILAIAGLVAGIVIAYQKSETFREIVKAALDVVKGAFLTLGSVALSIIDGILGAYQKLAEAAGRLPGPLGAPFRAAAEAIGGARAKVDALQAGIDVLRGKTVTVDADTGPARRATDQLLAYINSRQGRVRISGVNSVGGIAERAHGGPLAAGQLSWVGERGPELVRFDRPSHVYSNPQSMRMAGGDDGALLAAMQENTAAVLALREDVRRLPREQQAALRQGVLV